MDEGSESSSKLCFSVLCYFKLLLSPNGLTFSGGVERKVLQTTKYCEELLRRGRLHVSFPVSEKDGAEGGGGREFPCFIKE